MEEGSGKKGCGAAAAALLAALGIGVARGADDCALAACRAGSHAEAGLAGSADDALRLGRVGSAAGEEGAVAGRLGSSSDDLAGLGLVVGEEAAHGRSLAGEIAEEAAHEAGVEALYWALDDGDEEDGEEEEGGELPPARQPYGAASADRLLAHMMARDPELLTFRPSAATSHEAAIAALSGSPRAAPLGVAGVSRDGGTTIDLGGGTSLGVAEIHRACWELGRACLVLACDVADDTRADACLDDVATMFASFQQACSGRVMLQAEIAEQWMDLRRRSPFAREIVISRIVLGTISHGAPNGTPQIVVSRQR